MPAQTDKNTWLYTLIRVLLFCIGCAAMLAIISALFKQYKDQWAQLLPLFIAIMGTWALTALFIRWNRLSWQAIGVLPGRYSTAKILLGFVIGLLLALLQVLLVYSFGHLKLTWSMAVTPMYAGTHLLLYILAATREELAFRAYPLRALTYAMGAWKAQLIVALIFSLEHVAGGMNWLQAFAGSGTGAILFGIAALKTRGIALPAGMHAAWNFGQWCMGFKNEAGIWQATVDKGFEIKTEQTGLLCYLLVMFAAICWFYFYTPVPRAWRGAAEKE